MASRSTTRTVASRLFSTRRFARRACFRRVVIASSSTPPYEPTWSNPRGSAIDAIDAEGRVFACARPFVWNNIDVGGRMGVVRMADGESLWVHSPTALDEETRRAVTSLGRVAHVVSPNYEHVKYAAQWKEAFPDAVLYGCPGLKDRMPNVYDVDLRDGVPESWRGEFELAWFDCEETPIVGGAFFNEVVFHHIPSETLFLTDIFWNYPSGVVDGARVPPGTAAWKFLMDRVYLPLYLNAMVTDKERFLQISKRVCEEWDWSTLVPCHGTVERGEKARTMLREHLGALPRDKARR